MPYSHFMEFLSPLTKQYIPDVRIAQDFLQTQPRIAGLVDQPLSLSFWCCTRPSWWCFLYLLSQHHAIIGSWVSLQGKAIYLPIKVSNIFEDFSLISNSQSPILHPATRVWWGWFLVLPHSYFVPKGIYSLEDFLSSFYRVKSISSLTCNVGASWPQYPEAFQLALPS